MIESILKRGVLGYYFLCYKQTILVYYADLPSFSNVFYKCEHCLLCHTTGIGQIQELVIIAQSVMLVALLGVYLDAIN
jgi:hypothetical protein